jgi:hypothetical protein
MHMAQVDGLIAALTAAAAMLGMDAQGMVQEQAGERIRITSEWGEVTAALADNNATRSLMKMLPVTIEMRDHLRQEKTGRLPAPLPEAGRQPGFSAGTLGLWDNGDFVIYYRDGRVPQPGIIVLGQITGNAAIFDRPGPVTVRIQKAD